MGLEESSDNDPCKFNLTSRSSTGGSERFVLHSSSPAVCHAWVQQISSILENQRNFLNGNTLIQCVKKVPLIQINRSFCRMLFKTIFMLLSTNVSHRVPAEPCGREHFQPGHQRRHQLPTTWIQNSPTHAAPPPISLRYVS